MLMSHSHVTRYCEWDSNKISHVIRSNKPGSIRPNNWLVVLTILKNMSSSMGRISPYIMENTKCLKPPARASMNQCIDIAQLCWEIYWIYCFLGQYDGDIMGIWCLMMLIFPWKYHGAISMCQKMLHLLIYMHKFMTFTREKKHDDEPWNGGPCASQKGGTNSVGLLLRHFCMGRSPTLNRLCMYTVLSTYTCDNFLYIDQSIYIYIFIHLIHYIYQYINIYIYIYILCCIWSISTCIQRQRNSTSNAVTQHLELASSLHA